jgi:GR25 family glycosyltransferase involved in LPS biosynthesis
VKSFKVFIIDSNLPSRSSILIREIEKCTKFELIKIEATMVSSLLDVDRRELEYSDVDFRKATGRSLLPGEIGCANSHNIARRKVSSEVRGALILEDDARVISSDKLARLIEEFDDTIRDESAILSLTDFLSSGREPREPSMNQVEFFKLRGEPPLAVAYYLRPKAAKLLLDANTPINTVADWPKADVKFFVSNSVFVTHGDKETQSLIEVPGGEIRNSRSSSFGGVGKHALFYLLSPLLQLHFKVLFNRLKKSLDFRLDSFLVKRKIGKDS